MGAGDWVMATGEVKRMYAENPLPVLVLGVDRSPQWSEVFEHNPKIARFKTGNKLQILINGPGARPYIAGKSPEKWLWKTYGPTPGEMIFTKQELEFGARYGAGAIMIEPNTKRKGNPNKGWPFERWQQVVNRLHPKYRFVQCGNGVSPWLNNVSRVVTPTFRYAAAVLVSSRTLVSPEGGLMHAAAAVNKPSVILWSEFIDPTITGYEMHKNIRHASRTCGMRLPCPTCKASMEAITVDEVELTLRSML